MKKCCKHVRAVIYFAALKPEKNPEKAEKN
jgi:uncharacterized Zn finger protein